MEEPLEVKGKISSDRNVGVDEDGKVVVEKQVDAADKLRVLEMTNNRLKDDLDMEMRKLERCRRDMAHPALGGEGKYKDLPEVDSMEMDNLDSDELSMTEDGELKMVERRKFMDMYKAEKKREKSIKLMTKTVKKYRKDCELDMSYARQKVGLPGKRYEAKGSFDAKGQWIKVHEAEKSIEDAFKIKKYLKTSNQKT